jgi:hypothetical protein
MQSVRNRGGGLSFGFCQTAPVFVTSWDVRALDKTWCGRSPAQLNIGRASRWIVFE